MRRKNFANKNRRIPCALECPLYRENFRLKSGPKNCRSLTFDLDENYTMTYIYDGKIC